MRSKLVLARAALILSGLAAPAVVVLADAPDASVGIHKKQIYPAIDTAAGDIDAALSEARRTHKRVILDFGGDWCPDCQVLDIYFHRSPNSELLAEHFIRVNINVGRLDANKDIAAKYGVPLKGVPALAVLDGEGKTVYAQNKEFSDMRHLDPTALTAFLNQWKP